MNTSQLPRENEEKKARRIIKPHSDAQRPKKWSLNEDILILQYRDQGMTWVDISKELTGRSPTSCRLHHLNRLKGRGWDEDKKNKIARIYLKYVLRPIFPNLTNPG
jgi:hypothetical protein